LPWRILIRNTAMTRDNDWSDGGRILRNRARRSLLRVIGVCAVAVLILSGCAAPSTDDSSSDKGYVTGDGTVAQWPVENRGDPINFSGVIEDGQTVTSNQYAGQVLVVNFWYASCPPCRAEAGDLQALNELYSDQGVSFLGVNVRDQVETAKAFTRKFSITYPSIIDTEGKTALAFAGDFAPNAVPTTLVLDREGRPAARILGQIAARSILDALIAQTLAEEQQ
jgi:peroxiredoxin